MGTLPDAWSFSIEANLQWINVLFEVLEEAFLLPLFFTLRRILASPNLEVKNKKISWQIIMIAIIYITCIITFIVIAKDLLEFVEAKKTSLTKLLNLCKLNFQIVFL